MSLIIFALASINGKRIYPISRRKSFLVAGIFSTIALAVMVYFYFQYHALQIARAGAPNTTDLIFGAVAIILVLECTRAQYGLLLPSLVIVFMLYALFGFIFPGELWHAGLKFSRLISVCATEIDGIYGTLNALSCSWIAIFVFYAGQIQGFGGFDLVLKGGMFIAKRFKYMLGEVAVFSSLVFGMFSGSAGANAAGTGSFTIPMMKRFGIPAEKAGAIEATASSCGQIMPPIMGAAAFLMAAFLTKPYIEIMVLGFAPALIAYLTIALAVYIITRRFITIAPTADKESKPGQEVNLLGQTALAGIREPTIYDAIPIFVSLAFLIVLLAVFQFQVLTAGYFATCSFLALRFVFEMVVAKGRLSGIVQFVKGIVQGLRMGALNMFPIAIILGSMGIVVKILTTTGLSQKISFLMVDASGGNMLILMFLIAGVCILFGMAVSTVAAYILVVLLAAPALLQVGIDLTVGHFTVFYLAMLSAITPPVAAVAAITAGIAKASFLKTCWEAIKIGIALFILPFAFVYRPELFIGSPVVILGQFSIILVGIVAISLGIHMGWSAAKRVIFIMLGAITIFWPVPIVSLSALGIIVLLGLFEVWRLKRAGMTASKYW